MARLCYGGSYIEQHRTFDVVRRCSTLFDMTAQKGWFLVMEHSDAQIEALMREPHFRSLVSSLVGREVSRSRLYELRKELALKHEAFTANYARVLAYYAKLRNSKRDPQSARQLTIQFAKDHNL